jgi:ribonuclease-3 family protein
MSDCFHPAFTPDELGTISALGLAHIGDAVFELLVRTWLCAHGLATPDRLHRETVRRVSAPAQAEALDLLLPHLTEDECAVYKRGRNTNVHGVPKNATRAQYGKATGLETLFGSLYLSGQTARIGELFDLISEGYDNAV